MAMSRIYSDGFRPACAAFSLTIKYSGLVNLMLARISFRTVLAGLPAFFLFTFTGSIALQVLYLYLYFPMRPTGA
jgi:hypothetical protein